MKSELNSLKPQPRCLPVNLLDFLEADNSRLRRTVIELSLDVLVLRDAFERQRFTSEPPGTWPSFADRRHRPWMEWRFGEAVSQIRDRGFEMRQDLVNYNR
jgi:hypothetical protein